MRAGSFTDLLAKGEALVAKLDECEPHIQNAAVFMHAHGMNYRGPQYGEALEAFRDELALLVKQRDGSTSSDQVPQ